MPAGFLGQYLAVDQPGPISIGPRSQEDSFDIWYHGDIIVIRKGRWNTDAVPELPWQHAVREPAGSGGGDAPDFLPGLGRFIRSARFVVVVCRDCGLARFFASPEARAKLKEARKWKTVSPSDRGGFR
jgi:hypothetical protein